MTLNEFIPISSPESLPLSINQLAVKFHLTFRPVGGRDVFCLAREGNRLVLLKMDEPQLGAIYVDFVFGSSQYRRKFGGGKEESIAKAVGARKGKPPSILDATAGLGRDAFVLASLGCRVHMMERCGMVALLLADGLNRAIQDKEIGSWVQERLSLDYADSRLITQPLPFTPDVVYLDPMFPERKKSAMVKKEMRVFKELVGWDEDADQLLDWALKTASKKVIVKRTLHAPYLADKTPQAVTKTKSHRFDSYLV